MQKDVPLSEIVPNPFQPRQEFDPTAIRSLADEIHVEGFWTSTLQGRRNARGKVELVAGHRRLRALHLLKTPSVKVEILNLTDAQMAMRALEENLQREGLNDYEKADAISRVVELERKRRRDNNEPERGAIEAVAKLLGLQQQWISLNCAISTTIVVEDREAIDGAISAKTALHAKKWGKKRYIKTLVRQAREAKKNPSKAAKPTEHTIAAMKRAVMEAPEDIRSKVEERVFNGDLVTPQQVEQSVRSMKAAKVKREKEPPPDLKVVIDEFTDQLTDWNAKLKTVLPYMDYIEELPPLAKRFRKALADFIDTAKEVLKASR